MTAPTPAGRAIIERCARANEPSLWEKIDQWIADDDWNGGIALNAQAASLDRARRRLAEFMVAIREPTAVMTRHASDAIWKFSPDYAPSGPCGPTVPGSAEEVAGNAWRAMIAALARELGLSEPGEENGNGNSCAIVAIKP